jgi:mycothiol synthase
MIREKLPQGATVRPATMNDLEAVAQLMNAGEIALYGKPETTLDELRIYWMAPDFNLETDSRAIFSADGQMVGIAAVDQQEHAHIYTEIYVHPDSCGRGIGSYLLQWTEERGRQHIAEAAPDVRVVLLAREDSLNTAAHRLLERHGFTLVRHFWRMGVELHEAPPAAQWAEGITLRTMEPGMERAIFDAKEESFQDHWGHMPDVFEWWKQRRIQQERFDPSLWFVAMDGDEVAGFAICADEQEAGGWVHTMGVRRQWRRKGIGLALLYQAFAEFYRRGIHNVYLGVDAQSLTGATRLYERAGMYVVRQYNTYEKELRAGRETSTQTVEG